MNTPHFAVPTRLVMRLIGATILATIASVVNAAGAADVMSSNMASSTANTPTLNPQAQYKADVAHCKSGMSNEGQATCMKEAGAALYAAKHGKLTTSPSYTADQTARCHALPADQQANCMAMMSDQGSTKVQGSVEGGGVLRETTITIPAGSQ